MKIFNKRELQQIASNHLSDTEFKNYIKFCKDCSKTPFSFLVNDTILLSDNEKNRTINNKIKQKEAQYDFDREKAKTSALPPENLGKYKTLTGEDLLPEKDKTYYNRKI